MIIFISTSAVLCVIREYPELCWCYTVIAYCTTFLPVFCHFSSTKQVTNTTGNFHCTVRKIKESKFTGESTNSFSLLPGNDLKIDIQCSNMMSIFLSPPNEVPVGCWRGGTSRLLVAGTAQRIAACFVCMMEAEEPQRLPACSAFQ